MNKHVEQKELRCKHYDEVWKLGDVMKSTVTVCIQNVDKRCKIRQWNAE